jgi:hypothetical protein
VPEEQGAAGFFGRAARFRDRVDLEIELFQFQIETRREDEPQTVL